MYFIGIDLGTSSVKSLLMDETGHVLGCAQREYDMIKTKAVYAEQDMEILWNATCETLCELMQNYPQAKNAIFGIGFSGQMHGLVMLDRKGRLVGNAIIWADQRSGDTIRDIYNIIPKDVYCAQTLNELSTGFLASSLVWLKEHEKEVFGHIDKVMLPKDYIRYRMTGELGTDMTDASSSGIFDTAKRQWAYSFINKLRLSGEWFVPCHEAYEIAGEITEECSKVTGLPKGTKVVYGGGDSIMQAVGNGMIAPGVLTSNIGTASQLACAAAKPLHDKEFRTNTFCHVQKDQWIIMGANLSGGIALKWLKNNILQMKSYDEMTNMAAAAAVGSDGLYFLPYLNGERTPWNDPNAKGIYFGLNLKHGRAEIIRSTMEGILFSQKNSLEIFRNLGIQYHKIIASGGGARGRIFREIQANMFGCDVYTSLIEEQACVGAAITAAVGCGTYGSYQEACDHVVRLSDEVMEPDQESMKIYEERYLIFKELYPGNKELFWK